MRTRWNNFIHYFKLAVLARWWFLCDAVYVLTPRLGYELIAYTVAVAMFCLCVARSFAEQLDARDRGAETVITSQASDVSVLKSQQAETERRLLALESKLDEANQRLEELRIAADANEQAKRDLNEKLNWFLGLMGTGLAMFGGKLYVRFARLIKNSEDDSEDD